MARELTDQQKRFLEALPGSGGNIRAAMDEAGYGKTIPQSYIIKSLHEEIIQTAKEMLAANAPYAVAGLVDAMGNSTAPGIQHKLKAITEVLDRAGVIKEERMTINSESGLFILPPKNAKVEEDE